MTRLSRRSAMSIVLPVVAAPALSASASPEADLIAACERYQAIEAEINRLFELECEAQDAGDKAAQKRLEAAGRALSPQLEEARRQVNELPALTTAGLLAKTRVHLTRCQYWADGEPMEDSRELHSICHDVLRMLGAQA